MENVLSVIGRYWPLLVVVGFLCGYKLFLRLLGIVMIPDDALGVVNKHWVLIGKNRTLPDGAIVALSGEAGIQADTLAPGIHFWLYPWQYSVVKQKFTVIPPGQLAIVESRDGKALSRGRVLGRTVECNSFQDSRAFLMGGGERGPQLAIIPPGTYRINQGLFSVTLTDAKEIPDNMLGVVTTKDGTSLAQGEIAGPIIAGHNSFQDPQKFIDSGGSKGLQEQVILAGRYFINPLFATIETKPLTSIPIATVGVVVAFVGKKGADVTGDKFQHGNQVAIGEKGVWAEPLDPGVYPLNPYTYRVEVVPTANVVLNWATGKTEAHQLDKNLSTIAVRSSDGFTFNLDVSQIIHIPRNEAPKVIARFGNMNNLVTQVLEPTIGNYFRNAAQKSDVIDFLKNRSTRQNEAKLSISGALDEYNVKAVDTLIGDITPPPELMKTLTDKKIAEQQKITFETQKIAEDTRKDLEQSRATATTQATVVNAEREVAIAEFKSQSMVKKAEGDSKSKTINAQADAEVIIKIGNAEAGKVKAIGSAEAEVIELKIKSMEAGNYASVQIAQALAEGHVKIVPDISVGGGSGGGMAEAFLAQLVMQGRPVNGVTPAPNQKKDVK